MVKIYGFYCLLLTAFYNLSCAEDPRDICPPQELIDPCFCEKICVNCHASIRCRNIQHHEIIPRVLNQSRDYQYESLEITNATIMFVPASIFEIKKLTTLYVYTSKMVSLFDHPPSVNYDMEVIMLNGATLTRGMQWEMLAGIQKIRRLKFMYSPLRIVDRTFKDSVPRQLEELDIYNCSTETVDDRAFSQLTNLLEFSLEYGKLKVVKRSMFPNPAKIRSIYLGVNNIESLPEDIFSDMPDLKNIRLNGNRISVINENTFKPLFPRLTLFKINGNPIDCHCTIRWIVTVDRPNLDWRKFDGDCAEPPELAGKALRDLKTSDFAHCG